MRLASATQILDYCNQALKHHFKVRAMLHISLSANPAQAHAHRPCAAMTHLGVLAGGVGEEPGADCLLDASVVPPWHEIAGVMFGGLGEPPS